MKLKVPLCLCSPFPARKFKGLSAISNVWLGTTAENPEQLAIRAWHLSQVPAVVRFLSCEPLLSGLDFNATNRWGTTWNALTGRILHTPSGPASTGATFIRLGKANAGRLLDGREHNEFPR